MSGLLIYSWGKLVSPGVTRQETRMLVLVNQLQYICNQKQEGQIIHTRSKYSGKDYLEA
jgi:hypothetical protein